ncbi:hypothetical protein [Streptomyces sp. WM6378]|uniref:hypothetical protein n=1 Tax=Streptomyces sp. WM6378 TaxID=1415557 RepID=UPI0006AF19A0|nr:hypothetical protein [Streptomyces sp. WM6378]KOU36247.1 hypothetical protein ADK54_34570 [Streptomyces sp. WM6378]
MTIALTARCVHDSNTMVAQTVGAVLAATGAPAWLTWRVEETARVAAQYVAGHSEASCYRLLVHADTDGVTVSVTDSDEPAMDDSPAWLPILHTSRYEPPGARHDAQPPANRYATSAMLLERTPDGHIRLGSRTPWIRPDTTA